MKSVNFVVLGKQDIASNFGKKGTVTDLSLYDRKELDESKLDSMIKGTIVEKYTKTDQDKIKEEIDKLESLSNDDSSEMVIDHCFDVKGVGTVILGEVTNGKIKQYDNLKLYPAGIDVLIKSIQMYDNPVDESVCPARVGLAVKGAKPEEVGVVM